MLLEMATYDELETSSQSADLVQDVASDCSVVASICAGVARSERGHPLVRLSNSDHPTSTDHD